MAAAFFGAAAFLGAAFLAAVAAAGFLVVAAAGFFAVAVGAFFAAAAFLGAAAFLASGFLALASLVLPEGPLGCSKTPLSTPFLSALLKRESNCLSEATFRLLLALTYFLRF